VCTCEPAALVTHLEICLGGNQKSAHIFCADLCGAMQRRAQSPVHGVHHGAQRQQVDDFMVVSVASAGRDEQLLVHARLAARDARPDAHARPFNANACR